MSGGSWECMESVWWSRVSCIQRQRLTEQRSTGHIVQGGRHLYTHWRCLVFVLLQKKPHRCRYVSPLSLQGPVDQGPSRLSRPLFLLCVSVCVFVAVQVGPLFLFRAAAPTVIGGICRTSLHGPRTASRNSSCAGKRTDWCNIHLHRPPCLRGVSLRGSLIGTFTGLASVGM